jgi:hypothetical protein
MLRMNGLVKGWLRDLFHGGHRTQSRRTSNPRFFWAGVVQSSHRAVFVEEPLPRNAAGKFTRTAMRTYCFV